MCGRVWFANRNGRPPRRVQASDSALRRCGAFHGHRGGCRRRAVARANGGTFSNGSSAMVQRYGGTVDNFTGDGIMAVFGAPICAGGSRFTRMPRRQLDIQKDVHNLDDEVQQRDRIKLQLRVGLNSGEVITGEIGSGPLAYTTVGVQVGMAQRMESVAPAGGVMVSESTARLVASRSILGERELVHIKGAHEPVPARRLLAMATGQRAGPRRAQPRRTAMGVGRSHFDIGPVDQRQRECGRHRWPGRDRQEPNRPRGNVARPRQRGRTYSPRSVSRTLPTLRFTPPPGCCVQPWERMVWMNGRAKPSPETVFGYRPRRSRLARMICWASGIRLSRCPDRPDARRRRLSSIVNAAALARVTPSVFVIEDVHWVNRISGFACWRSSST